MNDLAIWAAMGAMAAVVVVVVAYMVVHRRAQSRMGEAAADRLDTVIAWPPKGTRVLNSAEREAYANLVRALPGYVVLAQVPLARFLKVPKRYSYSEWLRRLGSQCADLLVCDTATEVIAVVSVRPPVAEMSERALKRHARLERVLNAAEIPLHVWTSTALPSPQTARELLLPNLAAAEVSAEARTPMAKVKGVAPAARPAPAESPSNPFDELERDSSMDERIEFVEPPLSTWFDEFNSGPAPLPETQPKPRSNQR